MLGYSVHCNGACLCTYYDTTDCAECVPIQHSEQKGLSKKREALLNPGNFLVRSEKQPSTDR